MKMPKTIGQLEILHERRLVELPDGSLGYFHCWEHYSRPMDPSPLIGGGPGGTFCNCFALIEKEDGVVSRCDLCDFRFVDEEHGMLGELSKNNKERHKCQT